MRWLTCLLDGRGGRVVFSGGLARDGSEGDTFDLGDRVGRGSEDLAGGVGLEPDFRAGRTEEIAGEHPAVAQAKDVGFDAEAE